MSTPAEKLGDWCEATRRLESFAAVVEAMGLVEDGAIALSAILESWAAGRSVFDGEGYFAVAHWPAWSFWDARGEKPRVTRHRVHWPEEAPAAPRRRRAQSGR